jgi:carbamoyl-phosphate synthase large subunit
VLAVIANEAPTGVVVGFGGQTPLKLARVLAREAIPILGTGFEAIESAENRELFGQLLERLGLKSPPCGTATSVEQALRVAEPLGYPVLVRPSYILGGRAMEIVDTPEELRHFVAEAARVSPGFPVLIDHFLENAVELDVDVLTDGHYVWLVGLMEQIEEAGVHSGDSACVLPPVSLSDRMINHIENVISQLVTAMGAVGLVNVQLAIQGDELFVLEANPRASRTVPFVSKAIGIPVARLAAKVLVGRSLPELVKPYWPFPVHPRLRGLPDDFDCVLDGTDLLPTPWPGFSAVKEVVLPFGRFRGCDVLLGPEMRSTGEVMGFGTIFPKAFAKAQIAAGNTLPVQGTALVSLADPDKREGVGLVAQLHDLGFEIIATQGTAQVLEAMGVPATLVLKVGEGRPDVVDTIAQGKANLVINTPSRAREHHIHAGHPMPSVAQARGLPLVVEGRRSVGYRIRTTALNHHVPYVTTLVALRATVAAIRALRSGLSVRELGELTRVEREVA